MTQTATPERHRIVGLAPLIGALRHGGVRFDADGTGAALATVLTPAALCLVLP